MSYTHNESSASAPPREVLNFLQTLIARYHRLAGDTTRLEPDELDARLDELTLGEATLRLLPTAPHRPPQAAILGPTQTGKSTVVNLLLGRGVAGVSPLAGFTVHPHGFTLGDIQADDDSDWLAGYLPDWRRLPPDALERDELGAYTLHPLPEHPAALRGTVLWDTPDFDSLAARTYRRGVLETVALADVLLLVLSKEKYADLSVWRVARLVRPLDKPIVICLNKSPDTGAEVIESELRRWLPDAGAGGAGLITLPYDEHIEQSNDAARFGEQIADAIAQRFRQRTPAARRRGAIAYLRAHWNEWAAPIEAEHAALHGWRELIDAGLQSLLASYRRDFLDHPQRYDTFRRATAQLLELLEVPGIGGALARVRRVVTWPARMALSAGRRWFSRTDTPSDSKLTSEELVLREMLENLLTRLKRDAARNAESHQGATAVWRCLLDRLEKREQHLRTLYRQAADAHRAAVTEEVERAAEQMYEKLEQNPRLLNTLRAARVTTDAAGVILAVKTGGLTPIDALYAPAMFSVTSLLTEGALGAYMRHVAAGLKDRQYRQLKRNIVDGMLGIELYRVATRLDDPVLFGISPEAYALATDALDKWERASG